MAKKLYVRFSTSDDEESIFDFYNEHQHQFVFKRDPEVWKERISSGAVTIVHDEAGKIVASSISYPVTKDTEEGESHEWTEIGSTRVALDGLGLFKTLISAQILRAYLLEPPNDRFALEIIEGNTRSKELFAKLGVAAYDIPDEFQKKVQGSLSSEAQKTPVEWFQIGVELIPQLAGHVMADHQNPRRVHKKTGEEFELDFSRCALIKHFKEQIEDLSLQDYGDAQKPNEKHGVRAFRDKFHP